MIVRFNTEDKFESGGSVTNNKEMSDFLTEYYEDYLKRNLSVDLASYRLNKFVTDNDGKLPSGLIKQEIWNMPEYQKLKSEYAKQHRNLQELNKTAAKNNKSLSHVDRQKALKMYKEHFEKVLAEENKEIKMKKGDLVYDNKREVFATVKRVHKPKKGSALEKEPILIDVKYDDGSAINMPVGNRFVLADQISKGEETEKLIDNIDETIQKGDFSLHITSNTYTGHNEGKVVLCGVISWMDVVLQGLNCGYESRKQIMDRFERYISTVKIKPNTKRDGYYFVTDEHGERHTRLGLDINKYKESQLSKGTKVELEHKDTIEEIALGKLTTEQAAEKIASDHIAEDPAYYDKLETIEGKKEDTIIAYTDAKDNYDGFGTKTIEVTPYKTHRGDSVRKIELPVSNHSWQSMRYMSGNRSFMTESDFDKHKDVIFTKDEPKKEFYELTYPEFAKSISLYPNQIDKTVDVSYQNEDGSSTILPIRINGLNENVANEYNRLQLEKFHLSEVKKAIANGIIVPKEVIDFYKSLDSLLQERYGVYFNEEKETEMNIEESEENIMLPYKNYKGQINPKSIIIKPKGGDKGRVFRSWHQANDALRYIIDQQKYSDAVYEVEFQDGETLDGTIDLEPKSFWDSKNNPLTWHLNTFWGNVSKASASPIMSQEGIDFAKKLVSDYNIGQNITNSNIETEIEPETPVETTKPEKVISPERIKILQSVMKEKKTAYNYVYDRLMKVAPDLMNMLAQAEYPSDVYGKSQYRTEDFGGNDAFMYLAVEGLEKDEKGRYLLSISHYYKQQGDMMCDPCMTVRLDPELKTVEAFSFKMDGSIGQSRLHLVYGMTKDGKEGVNLKEKKSQNSFLNTWSSNWVKQGHKVEFRPLPEKEMTGTPISAEAQAIIQPEWDKMQEFLNSPSESESVQKAQNRKTSLEYQREKFPIVVEWSEGSGDENIGFDSIEQLGNWLHQMGYTDTPEETYIKNKVWFKGYTSYVRIDISKQEADFDPQEDDLLTWLVTHESTQFNWAQFSEAKTQQIIQDANFTFFKGVHANYDNQFKLNKAIEEFLDSKTDDYVYGNEEKEFIYGYEGYGGLEKHGATGVGLLFEYYTPKNLIEKMWGLAYKYGFSTGKVLEPSVGVGRFLNYTTHYDTCTAYEISPYSAKICKIIHPKTNVIQKSFAEHFYKGNTFNPKFEKDFDLVIGNPPYGKMTDLRTHGENSRIGVSVSQYEHYFILRGLDCLKSGGLLVYVSTANLFTKGYEKLKEKISEKADLVDGYLLPNTTFKQTKVNTSLIVLRRK